MLLAFELVGQNKTSDFPGCKLKYKSDELIHHEWWLSTHFSTADIIEKKSKLLSDQKKIGFIDRLSITSIKRSRLLCIFPYICHDTT